MNNLKVIISIRAFRGKHRNFFYFLHDFIINKKPSQTHCFVSIEY